MSGLILLTRRKLILSQCVNHTVQKCWVSFMDIMDTEANQATAAQYFCSSATFSILQAVRVGYDVTSSSVHPAAHTRRLSVFKSDYSDSKINIKIIKSELGKQ